MVCRCALRQAPGPSKGEETYCCARYPFENLRAGSVDKLPLNFSAETRQFVDSRYMANYKNGFSFNAVDSEGKDSCMTAYRNQNKISNSR